MVGVQQYVLYVSATCNISSSDVSSVQNDSVVQLINILSEQQTKCWSNVMSDAVALVLLD